MWKRMKDSFIAGFRKGFRRKKVQGFTGFKIEMYRDGVLLVKQFGRVDQNTNFNFSFDGVVVDGVLVNGWTLTPHLG